MDPSLAQALCEELVECDRSVRAAAVANDIGNMIALNFRRSMTPLLAREEIERYAVAAVIRAMTNEMFAGKIGNLRYAMVMHEKVVQVTIPARSKADGKFFFLIGLDLGADYLGIVEKKVIPIIKKSL